MVHTHQTDGVSYRRRWACHRKTLLQAAIVTFLRAFCRKSCILLVEYRIPAVAGNRFRFTKGYCLSEVRSSKVVWHSPRGLDSVGRHVCSKVDRAVCLGRACQGSLHRLQEGTTGRRDVDNVHKNQYIKRVHEIRVLHTLVQQQGQYHMHVKQNKQYLPAAAAAVPPQILKEDYCTERLILDYLLMHITGYIVQQYYSIPKYFARDS